MEVIGASQLFHSAAPGSVCSRQTFLLKPPAGDQIGAEGGREEGGRPEAGRGLLQRLVRTEREEGGAGAGGEQGVGG